MDSYSDSTELPQGVAQLITNFRPRRGTLDTREGLEKLVAAAITGSGGILGLGAFRPDTSTELVVASRSGTLSTTPANGSGGWTAIGGSVATTGQCLLEQTTNVLLVADQTNNLQMYRNGATSLQPAGIPSPKLYKFIAGFESTETWSLAHGTQKPDYGQFIQGLQSIIFTNIDTNPVVATYTPTSALDLTSFSDGVTSTTSDYISFYLLVSDPTHITAATMTMTTSVGNTYHVDLTAQPQWPTTAYVATNFQVRKSTFSSTGSPNWNSITSVALSFTLASTYTASLTFDFLRLEKTGPIGSAGAAGSPNGTYYYRVTYISDEGEESDPSNESAAIAVVSQNVVLTNIPYTTSSRVVSRNLYRIGGTLSTWNLITNLANPTQTTYTDILADGDVGALEPTTELNQPYAPQTMCVHNRYVVLANLTDPDGTIYPTAVMVSNEDSFDVYDHVNSFFEIEPNSGFGIKWVVSMFGFVYVGKGDSIWLFDPNNLATPPVVISRVYGGVGAEAITAGDGGVYFLDVQGVVRYDGANFVLISEVGMSKVKNYIQQIPSAYLSTVVMDYFDHTLFVAIPQTGDTYPTMLLAFDEILQFWYVITGTKWALKAMYAQENRILIGAATTGYVYEALVGNDDDGDSIQGEIVLADNDYGTPERLKDYNMLYIFGRELTTTTSTQFQIYLRLDCTNITLLNPIGGPSGTGFGTGKFGQAPFGNTTYVAFGNAIHERIEAPANPLGFQGTYLGVDIKAIGRWSFRGLVEVVRMLGPQFEDVGG